MKMSKFQLYVVDQKINHIWSKYQIWKQGLCQKCQIWRKSKFDEKVKFDKKVKIDKKVKFDKKVKIDKNIKFEEKIKFEKNIKVEKNVKFSDIYHLLPASYSLDLVSHFCWTKKKFWKIKSKKIWLCNSNSCDLDA